MGRAVPELEKIGSMVPKPYSDNFQGNVARLLGRRTHHFPGAQPVSFSRKHLRDLKSKDYFVCEKSDGIRCLLWLTTTYDNPDNAAEERHFLIDRKNNYYAIPDLHFPRPGLTKGDEPNFESFHTDTILDGELLWDTYPDGSQVLKYLVFDCLLLDGQNLTSRTLDKRLAFFHEEILAPYNRLWEKFREDCEHFPFRVQKKDTQRSYGIDKMFQQIIPALKHGSDGLIFTCRETPYQFGTDENILKWKPADENTVDFKLDLRFPVLAGEEDAVMSNGGADDAAVGLPDYTQQPRLVINVFAGNDGERPDREFDTLFVEPEEWLQMKEWAIAQDDGLDGQIVECHKDKQGRWRFNRFRTDKLEGNHHTVVEKVLESIEDGVSEEDLRQAAPGIRDAWKEREKEVEKMRVQRAEIEKHKAEAERQRRKATDAAKIKGKPDEQMEEGYE